MAPKEIRPGILFLFVLLVASSSTGLCQIVIQLRSDGSIWQDVADEMSCSPNPYPCPSWARLDNNPETSAIAAGWLSSNEIYQLHKDGSIWQYLPHCSKIDDPQGCPFPWEPPCPEGSCPNWQQLDNNPEAIAITATGGWLYQLHRDRSIWRYTKTPCIDATDCPGWEELDNNPATSAITAVENTLYQLHDDGSIWQFLGTPCGDARHCTGWQKLDNNPAAIAITASVDHCADFSPDFPLPSTCPAAGQEVDALYQLHKDGSIWQYNGTPCVDATHCPGWQQLDNNPAAIAIAASAGYWTEIGLLGGIPPGQHLHQLHQDGSIWQYTGPPCIDSGHCPGWRRLDNNPKSAALAVIYNHLYQMHADGSIYLTWPPDADAPIDPWEKLDNNPTTIAIVVGDEYLGDPWFNQQPSAARAAAARSRASHSGRSGRPRIKKGGR
jgi:peptidyl-Asp metalloendopeptidase